MKLNVENNKSNEKIEYINDDNFIIKKSAYNIFASLIYLLALTALCYIVYIKHQVTPLLIVVAVLLYSFFIYHLVVSINIRAVFTQDYIEVIGPIKNKSRINTKDIESITEGKMFGHYYVINNGRKLPIFIMFNKDTIKLVKKWSRRRNIRFE